MSLLWVIAGSIFQVFLSVFLFMLVAVSAGSIANNNTVSELQSSILNISIYLLPLICLLSAGIVIFQYTMNSSSLSYWWNTLPIAMTIIYLLFTLSLSK